MKYLKVTLAIVGLMAFSQSYAQDVDAKTEKRFAKIDVNSDKTISLEELTVFYDGKKNKKGEAFDAAKILKRKDADDNGTLSLEEYTSKGKQKGKKGKKSKN